MTWGRNEPFWCDLSVCSVFFREQVLSQHQQENMCLENMMFSMENQYADHVSEENRDYHSTRNQIKKQVMSSLGLDIFGYVEALLKYKTKYR